MSRIVTFILTCWLFLCPGHVQGQRISYKAQSLYLYKMARYVSWPEEGREGDFIIGVLGNSPVLSELELMAALKKAPGGRTIVIKSIQSTSDIGNLHLLFLTSSRSRELKKVQLELLDRPVLIVAERDGLARRGAAVSFLIMENGVLRFEVNTTELKAHRLEMAQEFLQLGFQID
ncbi:MAG: YfiR family protein [Bacteroidota bacterium]